MDRNWPEYKDGGWPWTETAPVPYYSPKVHWPRISVLVPSFRQGHFIEETIRSILLQRYPNLELFVIDGGSDDNTTAILKRYDPWITKWVSEADSGQSNALNKGISWASGEYIAWQNSDDIYYQGALKALAEKALKGYDVVYSSIKGIDAQSREITRLFFSPFRPYLLKYYSIVFSNQAALYKAQLMKQLKWDESLDYAMDFDLEFRLWQAGAKFSMIKGFWGAIRFHADAKTVNEFYRKVKAEEHVVRLRYGIQYDASKHLAHQFPIKYTGCLLYIFIQRIRYGGILFRIQKMLGRYKVLYNS
jgi:glycosyltransferase involved in cell wall biosynthesis